jgi:hypothetical protein
VGVVMEMDGSRGGFDDGTARSLDR